MALATELTRLLDIRHPILAGPHGGGPGGRLAAAVTRSGGARAAGARLFRPRLDRAAVRCGRQYPRGDRLHHLAYGEASRAARGRAVAQAKGGHALLRRPRALYPPDQADRRNRHRPGAEPGDGRGGRQGRGRHHRGARGGGRGPWRLARRHRADSRRRRRGGTPSRGGGRRHRRRPRAGRRPRLGAAGAFSLARGSSPRRKPWVRRPPRAAGQGTGRRDAAHHDLRYGAQDRWPAPFTGRALANDFTRRWHGKRGSARRRARGGERPLHGGRGPGRCRYGGRLGGGGIDLIHAVEPAEKS